MPVSRLAVITLACALAGCGMLDRAPKISAPQSPPSAGTTPSYAAFPQPSTAPSEPVHSNVSATHSSRRLPAAGFDSSVQQAAFARQPEEIPNPPPDAGEPAPSSTWTLAELEGLALANNPSLGEAWARIRAAEGRWVQAGLPPNTVLGYSGQQLGSKGQAEQEGIYIGQEFVRLRKLRFARNTMSQEIQVAERQLAAQQQRVLTDVRLGYYEVLVAQRRLAVVRELLTINQGAVKSAKDLFDIEEVGTADVLRATVELQSSQLLLRTSQNVYRAAWEKLAAVLGMPELAPQPIVGDLTVETMQVAEDEVLFRLLRESPEVHAALAQVERERWALQRARVEPLPNVEIQGVVQADNSTHSTNGNLQATIPIPWLNRNQGGIREAESRVIEAQRSVARIELNLKRRLAPVYQEYASARNTVDAYDGPDGILANVKKTLDTVQANYGAGEISYIDLLTAQRTFAHTNLEYIEALGRLRAALAEIDGLLLKDSLAAAR